MTITETSDALTAAQQDMRKVQTEADGIAWMDRHYWPNIENDALYDELVAMHRAIVERVCGVGGG